MYCADTESINQANSNTDGVLSSPRPGSCYFTNYVKTGTTFIQMHDEERHRRNGTGLKLLTAN